jgi:hypothetical protein
LLYGEIQPILREKKKEEDEGIEVVCSKQEDETAPRHSQLSVDLIETAAKVYQSGKIQPPKSDSILG